MKQTPVECPKNKKQKPILPLPIPFPAASEEVDTKGILDKTSILCAANASSKDDADGDVPITVGIRKIRPLPAPAQATGKREKGLVKSEQPMDKAAPLGRPISDACSKAFELQDKAPSSCKNVSRVEDKSIHTSSLMEEDWEIIESSDL